MRGIEAFAHHGVHPDEKERGQPFLIDVEVGLSLQAAGDSDDLLQTVDYGDLAARIHELVAGERWNLIERVAQRIATLVLALPKVESVIVTVHKPHAPLAVTVRDVAVTIERRRP